MAESSTDVDDQGTICGISKTVNEPFLHRIEGGPLKGALGKGSHVHVKGL